MRASPGVGVGRGMVRIWRVEGGPGVVMRIARIVEGRGILMGGGGGRCSRGF